jgi:hypothetical protein
MTDTAGNPADGDRTQRRVTAAISKAALRLAQKTFRGRMTVLF